MAEERRVCRICDQEGPMSDFLVSGCKGRICAKCRYSRGMERQRQRRSTPAGRARYREYQRAASRRSYQRLKKFLDELRSKPCTDCGGTFPSVCMEFDHRDGRGSGLTVTTAAGGSMATLLAEIERCDLVCANCHRIRTAAQRNSGAWKASGRPRKPMIDLSVR